MCRCLANYDAIALGVAPTPETAALAAQIQTSLAV